jgi:hypothetical protein
MIERLDPFSLPQQAADRPGAAAPEVQKKGDASEDPRVVLAPRQRKPKAPRRK